MRGTQAEPLELVLHAAHFAAQAHKNQRRKNADADPYVNHVVEVARFLTQDGSSDVVVAAGLLHDVVEDCGVTLDDLTSCFGAEVADLVKQCTDNKSLDKVTRKKLQVAHVASISEDAARVKLADKLSNLCSLAQSPPVGWSPEIVRGYLVWSHAVVASILAKYPGLSNSNSATKLQAIFEVLGPIGDKELDAYYEALRQVANVVVEHENSTVKLIANPLSVSKSPGLVVRANGGRVPKLKPFFDLSDTTDVMCLQIAYQHDKARLRLKYFMELLPLLPPNAVAKLIESQCASGDMDAVGILEQFGE